MFPVAPPPEPPPPPAMEQMMEYKAPSSGFAFFASEDAGDEAAGGAADDKKPVDGSDLSNLRGTALIEAARTAGTQGGLHARYTEINDTLTSVAPTLNQVFRFGSLAIGDGRVLPPVITEAGNSIRVDDDGQSATSSARTWHIQAKARIITAMPDWRSYLVRHFQPVDMQRDVPQLLLPKNSDERKVWRKAIKQGWRDGVRQADAIFARQLSSLVRDLKGMMRYYRLVERHIILAPKLSEGRAGVTLADDGRTLRVDDRVLRLSGARFETQSRKWRARPLADK